MPRYRIARNGNPYGDPRGLLRTVAALGKIGRKDGNPLTWRRPNGEMATFKLPIRLSAHTLRWLPKTTPKDVSGLATAGYTYHVRTVADEAPDRILRYYSGAAVNLQDGNPRIAAAAQYAANRWGRVMCSGYKYTRKVAGTDVWSQHSAWPPRPGYSNAIDLTIYRDDKPALGTDMTATRKVALGLVAQAQLGNLQLRQVIFADQTWRKDNDWQPVHYSGVFHTHVHCEAQPLQLGTPVDG